MKPTKQIMINKISKAIENFGRQAQQDKETSLEDKLLQVDVLLDTLKFLDRYEENVKVLNEYYANKEKWNKER